MLPAVLFIGPTRSGTTWIDGYLRWRGDIGLPLRMKETFFFDKRFDRGLDWYERCFPAGPPAAPCVEVAPSLFHKDEPPARVARCLPGVRVVCILRDPVERAVSHYFHYRGAGEPDLSFAAMVERKPDIVEAGLYHRHLLRWIEALGSDAVHVLDHDALQDEPATFCRDLCRVLSVPHRSPLPGLAQGSANAATMPPYAPAARLIFRTAEALRRAGADRVVNALKSDRLKALVYGRRVGSEDRRRIAAEAAACRSLFRDDVSRLQDLLGRRLEHWL